ncbi:MAG: tail fiber domain-containing protein [Myxococcales bacterium]|nr:tail fiber domain-containing protein [Myxococcales bacterium]
MNTLVLSLALACGGGGKTSESADASTTAPLTTTDASTGPAATGSTGAPTTGGASNTGTATGGLTTGGPGTSSTGEPGTSSTGEPGTSSTGGPGTTTGSSSTGGSSGEAGSSSTGGDLCMAQGDSCAKGEACCRGLECCVGVPVPPGMEFCSDNCPISDRNAKTEFAAIDPAEVLRRVAGLEITTWRYKQDPQGIRHLGPMAQDFKAAFGLGEGDTRIFPLDATGVSMAAIQALRAENEALRDRLADVERRLATLER